eukprot:TRINITY_DN10405_c0_g1_i1.p1 TRINITY_DN10405_c0_g1~~TRINITY_DN10405_c0_g1_i1.p1  ORF type:complete len:827 (-),score=184.21 TRINITY_DN10405_c0_g1_i1:97-2205(-)
MDEDGTLEIPFADLVSDVDTLLSDLNVTLSAPVSGSVWFNASLESFVYTPGLNFNGMDSFEYVVCDGADEDVECCGGVVEVEVKPLPDAPICLPANFAIPDETTALFNFTPFVSDPDDSAGDGIITVSLVGTTVLGLFAEQTFDSNAALSVSFTVDPSVPEEGATSVDEVFYVACDLQGNCCNGNEITITVVAVNSPPTCASAALLATEDVPLRIQTLQYVSDPDSLLLPAGVSVAQNAENGVAVLSPSTGDFRYLADADFSGYDYFTYRFCDDDPVNSLCCVGRFNLSIAAVNDGPICHNETVSGMEDMIVSVSILSAISDPDDIGEPDPSSISVAVAQGGEIVDVDFVSGVVRYRPVADAFGVFADGISYSICDNFGRCCLAPGFISFNLSQVNDPPTCDTLELDALEDTDFTGDVASLLTDIDSIIDPASFFILEFPSHGNASEMVNDTAVVLDYSPEANFYGEDEMEYTVCDEEGACCNGTIVINVEPVSDGPTCLPLTIVINEDTRTLVPLLKESKVVADPPATIKVFTIVTPPKNGSIHLVSDSTPQQVYYSPKHNFFGKDSFGYQACDNEDVCCSNVVDVTIVPVADPLFCQLKYIEMKDAEFFRENLYDLLKDDDNTFQGRPKSVYIIVPPSFGEVGVNQKTGVLTYFRGAEFDTTGGGHDEIFYSICDEFARNCCGNLLAIYAQLPEFAKNGK